MLAAGTDPLACGIREGSEAAWVSCSRSRILAATRLREQCEDAAAAREASACDLGTGV
jgi:hypothetical protein